MHAEFPESEMDSTAIGRSRDSANSISDVFLIKFCFVSFGKKKSFYTHDLRAKKTTHA